MSVLSCRRLLRQRAGVRNYIDEILYGLNFFGNIVRNFYVELLLARHYELNNIQAISTQIADKARGGCHLRLFHAEMLY